MTIISVLAFYFCQIPFKSNRFYLILEYLIVFLSVKDAAFSGPVKLMIYYILFPLVALQNIQLQTLL